MLIPAILNLFYVGDRLIEVCVQPNTNLSFNTQNVVSVINVNVLGINRF